MASLDSYKEHALLEEISSGSEKAMKELFSIYHARLFHYISGFIKSDQVAEELVMDVFMKLWVGREMITQIRNLDAFLFRIAHNKSIDFLRAAAKDQRLKALLCHRLEAAAEDPADSALLLLEYEQKIREAIALLPPKRREVYLLSREEELSHEQIAQRLQISKSTVSNHIGEAQRFVRQYLSQHADLAVLLVLFKII